MMLTVVVVVESVSKSDNVNISSTSLSRDWKSFERNRKESKPINVALLLFPSFFPNQEFFLERDEMLWEKWERELSLEAFPTAG